MNTPLPYKHMAPLMVSAHRHPCTSVTKEDTDALPAFEV